MGGSAPRNPPRHRDAGLTDIVRRSYDMATEVFHSMENIFVIFPRYGKNGMIFPRYGRFFNDFSMLWKNISTVFHTMEEMFPCCGKLGI